jgi:chromate transporter
MIAVATITPGPVAINVATYAGLKAGGIAGALVVTTSEIMPEFIIGLGVAKLLKNFSENFYVQSALWALKPTSCALLAYVALKLFNQNILYNSNIMPGAIFFGILLVV